MNSLNTLKRQVLGLTMASAIIALPSMALSSYNRLTQSERDLLANVRQMQQFRQGFFIEIAAGRNSGEGPSRRGAVGASGLGLLAGSPGGRIGAPAVGGFFALLQEQQQIRNQEVNVSALRETLDQLSALFVAGRLESRLQVDQARQALFNAQSSLLASKAAYQTRLDAFKLDLGLPPDVPVRVADSMVEPLNLVPPAITQLRRQMLDMLNALRDARTTSNSAALEVQLAVLQELRPQIDERLDVARVDRKKLEENLPRRRQHLERLQNHPGLREENIDPVVYQVESLEERVAQLGMEFDQLEPQFDTGWNTLDDLRKELPELELKSARDRCVDVATRIDSALLEMMLLQAAFRLEAVVLAPIEVDPASAVETARINRLDWMNARARLVDTWRLIDVDANALESDLNVIFEGDFRTDSDNPVDFRTATGRLRAGIEFDTPITRLAERNNYRETLIEYQRARRDYMRFEDEIKRSLRNTLRIVELSQLNVELRRWSVRIAIEQVRQARLQLDKPPQPGREARFGSSRTRDLVEALNDLLNAQNDFLNLWVSYEALRMVLDFEMGTFQLDERGIWIDPGEMRSDDRGDLTEEIVPDPPEAPLPPDLEELPLPRN